MTDPQLFDPGPVDEYALPPDLSPDARRTARRNALLDQGVHPVTMQPTRPDLGTCGDCVHNLDHRGGRRTYKKCALVPVTSGPGTDIRSKWPACHRWEPSG